MNTEHTKHPCETVDASADVMKLAEMILSDCGQSTVIRDSLQRRVAGRIQLYVDNTTQQLQGQVGALLAAMDVIALGELPDGKYSNISTMMYAEEACKAAKRAPIKESLTADRQAEPVAWVRFRSDGCYEGPIMNSDSRMDGVRRTSWAWTPLFAAQPAARDVLMALAAEIREAVIYEVTKDSIVSVTGAVIKRAKRLDIDSIVDRYATQPPAVAVAAPDGSVPVPLGFLQAFHALAHNYSLQAQAPDHYAGTERDAFSDAYARCGSELAKLRAMLAAAPQAAVTCDSQTTDSEAQSSLCRNGEAQECDCNASNEPGQVASLNSLKPDQQHDNAPPAPDVIDMNDPANWQEGDIVLRIAYDWMNFVEGCEYKVHTVRTEKQEVYIGRTDGLCIGYTFDMLRPYPLANQYPVFQWLRHGDCGLQQKGGA